MVVPNVDRRTDGSVGNGHHNGQPQTGSVVDSFYHVEQSLRGRCSVGTCAAHAGADGHRHGCKFAFNVDVFAVGNQALAGHCAERFHNMGLRRNRIRADHLGSAQRHSLCNALTAFDLLEHQFSSACFNWALT